MIPDNKPFERSEQDGTPNLASFEFAAVVGMVELAHDLLGGIGEDDIPAIKALATELLLTTDRVQDRARKRAHLMHLAARANVEGRTFDEQSTRDTVAAQNRVDRLGASHTRARGAVRTAIEHIPLPDSPTADDLRDWLVRVENRATGMLMIAHDISYYTTSSDSSDERLGTAAAALRGDRDDTPTEKGEIA